MYSVSDSGWMEAANFVQWFQKKFLPAIEHMAKKLPVILFYSLMVTIHTSVLS